MLTLSPAAIFVYFLLGPSLVRPRGQLDGEIGSAES